MKHKIVTKRAYEPSPEFEERYKEELRKNPAYYNAVKTLPIIGILTLYKLLKSDFSIDFNDKELKSFHLNV